MNTFMWILAFIGVALIYIVPYIGKKFKFSDNLTASLKLIGVILSALALIFLYRLGGFN